MNEYTIAASIVSGGAIITAAILKFPAKRNGYITQREFMLWREGFDREWKDLKGWLTSIQCDVKELLRKERQ